MRPLSCLSCLYVCNVGALCRWMDQDATWYTEIGLGPSDIVLDEDPAPPRKGAQHLPTFRPMSIVAKRSPISAAAELLLKLATKS